MILTIFLIFSCCFADSTLALDGDLWALNPLGISNSVDICRVVFNESTNLASFTPVYTVAAPMPNSMASGLLVTPAFIIFGYSFGSQNQIGNSSFQVIRIDRSNDVVSRLTVPLPWVPSQFYGFNNQFFVGYQSDSADVLAVLDIKSGAVVPLETFKVDRLNTISFFTITPYSPYSLSLPVREYIWYSFPSSLIAPPDGTICSSSTLCVSLTDNPSSPRYQRPVGGIFAPNPNSSDLFVVTAPSYASSNFSISPLLSDANGVVIQNVSANFGIGLSYYGQNSAIDYSGCVYQIFDIDSISFKQPVLYKYCPLSSQPRQYSLPSDNWAKFWGMGLSWCPHL